MNAESIPLGLRTDADLSDSEHRSIAAIAEYDLSRVRRRLIDDGALPESWVDEALFEFRRFLGVVAVSPGPVPMTSRTVDVVWHTSLLFTKLYADLCWTTLGRFLDHEPTDQPDEDDSPPFDFRAAYTRLFGPPGHLWT